MGKKKRSKEQREADESGTHEQFDEPTDASEWGECDCCGQSLPIVAETGMCGVCTFGEAGAMYDF